MYIVGLLDSYSDTCFRSDDIQEVYEEARKLSEEDYETSYGVWANEGDDLVAIAHSGEIFLKATV